MTAIGASNGRAKRPAGSPSRALTAPAAVPHSGPAPSPTPRQLVIAIVQDEDAKTVIAALTEAHFRVTHLSTAGGFLRKGNATLLIGVERTRVPEAVRILQRICQTRTDQFVPTPMEAMPGPMLLGPIEVQVGGATIFVLDVQHVERV